jgi:DUF4097 and DUF4098 domain-containing protein YvlB
MATIQDTDKKIRQKEGIDQHTKLRLESLLEEINEKWPSSNQSTATDVRIRYIKFMSDKDHKTLSFTGKVDKVEVQAKDFETELDIPDKYVTRYVFDCYDITEPNIQNTNGPLSIWERGTRDARMILHYLSKGINTLEVVRNWPPGSKTTTYLFYPVE